MKSWLEFWWPLVWRLIILVITIAPLNIDLVVIPSLTNGGVHLLFWTFKLPSIFPKFSPLEVFLIASGMSILFTLYFYHTFLGWFFGGYSKNILSKIADSKLADQEPIKEGVQLWEKIPRWVKKEIKNYCVTLKDWATSEDNKIIKWLRRGGYPAIFVFSAIPEPGLRTATTIFAKSLNTRTALIMVLLGETIKNAVVLGLWNFAFWIF